MRYLYLTLFIITFSCSEKIENNDSKQEPKTTKITKAENKENLRDKELLYLKRRNLNVEYFKNKEFNNKVDDQMNDSIFALEKLLKNILNNTRIKDIDKTGRINLQTFFPELGFGMLDGLSIKKENATLFCTSDYIFSDFFPEHQFDNLTPSDLENIFSSAFAAGHVITNIHSFKINNEEINKAYGMISIDGQDIGPYTPNTLYAIASIDNVIYLINKNIEKEIEQLQNCIDIWNNVVRESEDEAWKEYCKCYKKEFMHNEQARYLKKEVDGMLKMITK